MDIWLDEDILKLFYQIIVDIYKDTEDPVTVGYSESMIQVSVERPLVGVYNFIPFPHVLHKATILMETIINFHPFVDGNKRVALLATYFFLYWNGYDLNIPEDAAEFTIDIAKGKHKMNDILSWLTHHSSHSIGSILRNKIISIYLWFFSESETESVLSTVLLPLFFSTYPFMFFREIIARKAKNRKTQEKP